MTLGERCGTMAVSVLFLLAVGAALLSYFQPTPGRHSWFYELAGDWTLQVQGTEYDIGNMPDESGHFNLVRWIPVPGANDRKSETMKEEVRDIVRYASDGTWIVAETTAGWAWVNSETKEVYAARASDDLEKQAPAPVIQLLGSLHEPTPSERHLFVFLSGCLTVAALCVLLIRRRQKRGTTTV